MSVKRSDYLPTRADLASIVKLACPIVLIQVGLIAMGTVESIMVGHVSAEALAAVALGHLYSFGFMSFGIGTLLALDSVIAQALGAGDQPAIALGVQRGLVLALLITVPTSFALLTVEPVLVLMAQPPEVVPLASGYVYRILPGLFPFFAFVALRQTLQAHHETRAVLVSIVVANLANVVLNYVWIYGKLGFPALGVLGSAWSTLVCRWLMGAMLLVLGWRHLAPHLAPRGVARGADPPIHEPDRHRYLEFVQRSDRKSGDARHARGRRGHPTDGEGPLPPGKEPREVQHRRAFCARAADVGVARDRFVQQVSDQCQHLLATGRTRFGKSLLLFGNR